MTEVSLVAVSADEKIRTEATLKAVLSCATNEDISAVILQAIARPVPKQLVTATIATHEVVPGVR